MEGTRSKYPCKPFYQYKRSPFEFKYPCQNEPDKAQTVTPVEKKEEQPSEVIPVMEEKVVEAATNYPPLKRQCSYPYFRFCRLYCRQHRKPSEFKSFWYGQFLNEWKRPKEELICINPPMKDSYEILCSIPLCKPKPVIEIRKRGAFNPVHCVFCDESLYLGGTIYDLYDTVPAIKRQSEDRDDDIAYRIGPRTRLTVHKFCYEKYVKSTISYNLQWETGECDEKREDCANIP